MKKTYLILFVIAVLFSSCKKEDALKDVGNAISKMTYFNETFDTFFEDGIIETEGVGEEDSEYDKLKGIATEYYDIMNKINNNIKLEKEKLEKGKKIDNYEEKYLETIKEKEDEILKATKLFEENLAKI